jgi:hypothetical protein
MMCRNQARRLLPILCRVLDGTDGRHTSRTTLSTYVTACALYVQAVESLYPEEIPSQAQIDDLRRELQGQA